MPYILWRQLAIDTAVPYFLWDNRLLSKITSFFHAEDRGYNTLSVALTRFRSKVKMFVAAERRWCYYIGGMLWWRPPFASFLGSRSQSLEEEVGVLSFEAPKLAGHYRRHIASHVSKYPPCVVPATADPSHKCWGGEGKFRNETGQVSVTINNAAGQTEWTSSHVRAQRHSPGLWCHYW